VFTFGVGVFPLRPQWPNSAFRLLVVDGPGSLFLRQAWMLAPGDWAFLFFLKCGTVGAMPPSPRGAAPGAAPRTGQTGAGDGAVQPVSGLWPGVDCTQRATTFW